MGGESVHNLTIHWTEGAQACSAQWLCERGAAPPKKVVLADDTMPADAAYRLACEGTALLWQGDFHNARQLLQALARRTDKPGKASKAEGSRKEGTGHTSGAKGKGEKPAERAVNATQNIAAYAMNTGAAASNDVNSFHLHRQAQAQRARVLSMVLVPLHSDYTIPLRRAPDVRLACSEAWGPAHAQSNSAAAVASVTSLRELLGLISAHEWRKKGVEVAALGAAPHNRIHPHYGVFSPLRGEYVALVAQAPLPNMLASQPAPRAAGARAPADLTAFDIGVGTGVLSAVLARRGVGRIVATDTDPRALACAADNLTRLGAMAQPDSAVQLVQANLFPPSAYGLADLIVCNPPWLPARPSSPIERAVYDEGSAMLLGFLKGLAGHLAPGGEGWLILSDLAEHLGLRSRGELLQAISEAGLAVAGRLHTTPVHGKASDATDPLHAARSREVTSLWRLVVRSVSCVTG